MKMEETHYLYIYVVILAAIWLPYAEEDSSF